MSWLRGRCFTKLLQERAGKWDRRAFWALLGTGGFKTEKQSFKNFRTQIGDLFLQ
jgi:hypothetical protein